MAAGITNTEMAVLGLIAEEARYGYQIEQIVEERGMREWTEIGFSSIYYLLNKMEKDSLLESDREEGNERPARKVFRVTEQGRAMLTEAVLARLRSPRLRSGDFDLALANLWILPPGYGREALETYRTELAERFKHVRNKMERDGDRRLPFHVRALFDHSLDMLRREHAWVEKWISLMNEEG